MKNSEVLQFFYKYFLTHKKIKNIQDALEKEFGIIPELMVGDSANSITYRIQCFLNKLYLKDVSRILEASKDKPLSIVFMKGVFLAADLYENYNYRLSCDLDILIEKNDLLQLDEILKKIGYSCDVDTCNIALYSMKNHIKYVKPIYGYGKLLIEVHTNICNPSQLYRGYTKWVMRRSKTVNLLELNPRLESEQDRLIHGCLHFFNHFYTAYSYRLLNLQPVLKWKSLIDIALMINKYGINTDYVMDVAKTFNCGLDIYCTFNIINFIIPNLVPRRLLNELKKNELNSEVITDYRQLDFIYETFGLKKCRYKLIDIIKMDYSNVLLVTSRYQNLFSFENDKFIINAFIKKTTESLVLLMECDKFNIKNSTIVVHYSSINRETDDIILEKIKCDFREKKFEPYITMPYNKNYQHNIKGKIKRLNGLIFCMFTVPIEAIKNAISIAPKNTISLSFTLAEADICLSGKSWDNFETMKHFKI